MQIERFIGMKYSDGPTRDPPSRGCWRAHIRFSVPGSSLACGTAAALKKMATKRAAEAA